jgi:hypothetical protein
MVMNHKLSEVYLKSVGKERARQAKELRDKQAAAAREKRQPAGAGSGSGSGGRRVREVRQKGFGA